MAAIFSCPACRQTISAEVPAGTPVQCPLCQQVVVVPVSPGMPGPAEAPLLSPPRLSGQPGVAPVPLSGDYWTASGYPRPGPTFQPPRSAPVQGLATAALVCGVLAMLGCLPVGLVGIVLGIVALVRTKGNSQRYGGKGLAIGGIATGAAGLLIYPLGAVLLWPTFMQGMETGMRQACAANMRQIGMALYAYARDNGSFPEKDADWSARLLSGSYITQEQLLCPSAMMGSGTSYYYVPGYGVQSNPTQIILYEHPDAHDGVGGNILYQDAHVAWVSSPQFEEAIDSITLPDGTPYTPHKVMWADDEEEEEGDG